LSHELKDAKCVHQKTGRTLRRGLQMGLTRKRTQRKRKKQSLNPVTTVSKQCVVTTKKKSCPNDRGSETGPPEGLGEKVGGTWALNHTTEETHTVEKKRKNSVIEKDETEGQVGAGGKKGGARWENVSGMNKEKREGENKF